MSDDKKQLLQPVPVAEFDTDKSTFSAQQNPTVKTALKQLLKSQKLPLIAGFLAGVIISIVGYSFVYFQSHTLPFTKLAGESIGFKSDSEIKEIIHSKTTKLSISLITEAEKTDISPESFGVVFDVDKTADQIFEKQPFISRFKFWQKNDFQYVYSYDKDKLLAFAESQKRNLSTPPQNATISIEDGQVILIDELASNQKVIDNPVGVLEESLPKASNVTLKLTEKLSSPEIKSKDLEPLKAHIQQMIDTEVNLTIKNEVVQPTNDHIASWLSIDKDSTSLAAVRVDQVKVSSYLDSIVQPYIEPPKSRVVVTAPDGSTQELVAGADGIDITDKTSVTKEVAQSIENSKNTTIDLPVSYSTRGTISAGDYDKWLHADLTTHRLYAYEHGTLVKEMLMTAGASATPTVVGQYKILYKVRKQTMRGLNSDGSRYTQPDVEWVNYFYQDYAVHGNYWRPDSVFGSKNTSHGCVGIRNNDAEWVYNWAPVGTPVITHY